MGELFTSRELELIEGMIEVQLRRAVLCDIIANKAMAAKQKGWNLERVAVLKKILKLNNANNAYTANTDHIRGPS